MTNFLRKLNRPLEFNSAQVGTLIFVTLVLALAVSMIFFGTWSPTPRRVVGLTLEECKTLKGIWTEAHSVSFEPSTCILP